jgi:hypothetical protein
VARDRSWWTTASGIDHLVEDTTRVLLADAHGYITWDRQAQRYAVGEVDEAELDRLMMSARNYPS